jgi:hypothetical protein
VVDRGAATRDRRLEHVEAVMAPERLPAYDQSEIMLKQ